MAFYRLFTGLFLLASAECFVNLAKNAAFPAATVTTNQDFNALELLNVIDNDANTCKQFTSDDKWIKIWLGNNANVGTIIVTANKPVTWKTAITIAAYNYSKSSTDSIQQNGKHFFPKESSPLSTSLYLNITVNDTYRGFYIHNQSTNGNLANLTLCEVTILGCYIYRYGKCDTKCSPKCKDHHCDAFDGRCIHGCQNRRLQDPDCNECKDGYYGTNCENSCGNCMDGRPCNKSNGNCASGCDGFWTGVLCKECRPSYYVYNDSCQNCGHCRGHKPCNNITGECTNGCEENWATNKCDVCVDGNYGQWCNDTCGHCLTGPCNKQNGTCENGCIEQWQAPLCKECKDHYYGVDCNLSCGNCFNNKSCDKVNGECFKGCTGHWDPPNCIECENNYYGSNCTSPCGHCKSGAPCSKTSGACPNGCQHNWNGTKCKVCVVGLYDIDCSAKCGKCKKGAPCDHRTGNCTAGCEGTQTPPLCQESLEEEQDIGVTVGASIGGVLFLGVCIFTVVLILRRRYNSSEKSKTKEGSKNVQNDARNSRERKYEYSQDAHYENHDDVSSCATETSVKEESHSEGGYYNISSKDTCIKIEDLQQLITEKTKGKEISIFATEFQELPSANVDICTTAQIVENVVKNRFKTTFPYEHSRIILKELWNESDNDYINANYIKDVDGEKRYIASQGPRKNTLADFWRMIWQENIETIVMLTNIIEGGKHKCSRYWPEEEDTDFEVGPCTIRLTKETVYASYVIRSLLVHKNDTSAQRTITQFHYTAWPDHGTPEEAGLIQFHRAVKRKYRPGISLLVHCSAGVGRTGTFIGLDSLLQQGTEQGKIDVFNFVTRMRGDRMTMVQTPDQYVFLHKALFHGFQSMDTLLALKDFAVKARELIDDTSPQNQRTLYQEFKSLSMLRPAYEEEDKGDAMKPENIKKNRIIEILPVSKYKPYLMTAVDGRNDYINAVFVPSFTDKTGFIITQTPLPDTEVDLWTLCLDHDVDVVVVLDEEVTDNAWLPGRGSSRLCSLYTVACNKTGSTTNSVTQDTVLISNEDEHKSLDVFKLPSNDASAFSTAIDLLQGKARISQFTTVVISKNGAEPAGIFCAVYNALEQLHRDEEVDMFSIVRQIHTRRPEVIDKLEDYIRCYQIVLGSVTSESIYANL